MRRAVFADTSAWVVALLSRERRHQAVMEVYQRILREGRSISTTNLVVAEMHALVMRARGAAAGTAFLDRLYADPNYDVRFVDRDLEREAVDRWLRPFHDKGFSLADAVSFEVMRLEGIRSAFALDRHFQMAGYELLIE